MSDQPTSHRKVALTLAGGVVGMFAFGFAMVPLYSLFCDVTGINKAGSGGRVTIDQPPPERVNYDRKISVSFDSTLNAGLNWDVQAADNLEVHPGKPYDIVYKVRNNSDKTVVAQAIPGITPWQATEFFYKTECFCFQQQKLEPGESADLTLRFVVSDRLPEKYNTLTLSYTFMDTDREKLKNQTASALHRTAAK